MNPPTSKSSSEGSQPDPLLVLAAVLAVANAWPSLWTAVDDAFISARYASQVVAGHGWVYSLSGPWLEGYSNWLWTGWIAVGLGLGAPVHPWMVFSGLVCLVGLVVGVHQLTIGVAGHPDRRLLLAPFLVAACPQLAIASTNGLETAAFLAGLTWSVWASLKARSSTAMALAGLGWFATGALRPEALALGLVWVGIRLARDRVQAWPMAVGFGAPLLALEAWRWTTYGAWVPNTLAAKSALPLAEQLLANLRYLGLDGPLWLVCGLGLAWAAARSLRDPNRLAVAASFLLPGLVAMRVELWMPGGRLILPWLLGSAVLGTVMLVEHGSRRGIPVMVLLAAAYLITPWHTQARRYDRVHSVLPDNGAAQAGQWLARHAPPDSSLAARDAGVLPFWVGPHIDVHELHHRALTLPHPDGRDADILAHTPLNPTFVVLTQAREGATDIRYGGDRQVFERLTVEYAYLGRVHQHYHRYYDLYARTDASVPALPPHLVVNHAGPTP